MQILSIDLVKSVCRTNSKGDLYHKGYLYDAWYIEGNKYDDNTPRIATFCYEGNIRLFNITSGKLEKETEKFRDLFAGLKLGNGNLLSEDRDYGGTMTVWDYRTLERLKTIKNEKLKSINNNYMILDDLNIVVLNYYNRVNLVCFDYDIVHSVTSPRMYGICRLKTDRSRFFTVGLNASFWSWDKTNTKIKQGELLNLEDQRLECCESYVSEAGEEFVCAGGRVKNIYIISLEGKVISIVKLEEDVHSLLSFSSRNMIVGGTRGLYCLDLVTNNIKTLIQQVSQSEFDVGGMRSHRVRWVDNQTKKVFYYVDTSDRAVKFFNVKKSMEELEESDRIERKVFLFDNLFNVASDDVKMFRFCFSGLSDNIYIVVPKVFV